MLRNSRKNAKKLTRRNTTNNNKKRTCLCARFFCGSALGGPTELPRSACLSAYGTHRPLALPPRPRCSPCPFCLKKPLFFLFLLWLPQRRWPFFVWLPQCRWPRFFVFRIADGPFLLGSRNADSFLGGGHTKHEAKEVLRRGSGYAAAPAASAASCCCYCSCSCSSCCCSCCAIIYIYIYSVYDS